MSRRTALAGIRICSFALLIILFASVLDSFNDPAVAYRSSSTTGVTRVELVGLATGDRFGTYTAIRTHAKASRVLVDLGSLGRNTQTPEASLQPEFVLALGRAIDVLEVDLGGYSLPAGSVVAEGRARTGAWSLHLDQRIGPPSTLLAKPVGGVLRIVDARLVPGWPDEIATGASEDVRLPAVLGGLIDSALLLLLILSGGSLIPHKLFSRAMRIAVSLPVGVAILGAVGILRIPGAWGLVATPFTGLAGWWWLRLHDHAAGWRREDWPALSLAAIVAAVVATWSRANGFIWTSPDSIDYLAGANLLADGRWTVDLVDLTRGMAQQQLHAPGFALGVEGFQSLGAAVLAAGAMLIMAETLRRGATSSEVVPGERALIAGTCAALLFAAPAVPVQAAYINSHVLLAVLLLSLVVILDHVSDKDLASQAGLLPAAGLILVAIILLRAEGTLLAALVLLGTLRANHRAHPALWRWLGSATLAWNGIVVNGYIQRGESPARVALVMIVLGVVLTLVPAAVSILPPRFVRLIPLVVGSTLWATTLVLLVGNLGDIRFLDAAIVNIGESQGRWGSFGLMLFLLGLLAVAVPERPSDGLGLLGARWALIGFIPLTLLSKLGDGLQSSETGFETLLSGGGRIGWGDSVNRMWTHAILLVLFLLIARFTQLSGDEAEAYHDRTGLVQERDA